MSYKRVTRFFGLAASICLASFADNAIAQVAGTTTLGIGWLHVMPQGSSDPLVLESVGGVPVNQQQNGTGAHAGASDAVSLMAEHLFTDHVGVAFLAGTPFTSELLGSGSFSSYGIIGKTKPLAPVVEIRYHFFAPDSRFRPFVGAGVNYTWYAHTRITNGQFLNNTCGPGCSTHAALSPSWNPTVELGMNYTLTKHWAINASLTYIPMSTTLTTNATTAAGTEIVTKLHIRNNPLITHLDIAYSF